MGAWFSTPPAQAWGWATLGVLGLFFAAGGIWLATAGGNGDSPLPASAPSSGASATATSPRTPTATATATTASPSPSPTETPAAATSQPQPAQPASTGTASPVTPEPGPTESPIEEPTPESNPEQVVAGGPYCPSSSATATPTRVLGILTIAGATAPPGTVVTLAFDGVAGPGEAVTISGSTAGFSIDFNAAQGQCANRVGAAIGAYVNGTFVASGYAVGGAGGQAGFIRFDIALP